LPAWHKWTDCRCSLTIVGTDDTIDAMKIGMRIRDVAAVAALTPPLGAGRKGISLVESTAWMGKKLV